jgi:hypothetical protein
MLKAYGSWYLFSIDKGNGPAFSEGYTTCERIAEWTGDGKAQRRPKNAMFLKK